MKNTWNAKAKARSKKRLEYFKERIRKIRIIEGAQMGIGINPNIVEQIKEERTLSCERCLKPHLNRPYKGLLIHHKDGNKLNNDLDNLQLLCRACHNIVHEKVKLMNIQRGISK